VAFDAMRALRALRRHIKIEFPAGIFINRLFLHLPERVVKMSRADKDTNSWHSLGNRMQFFLLMCVEMIVDSTYVVLVYFWTRLVHYVAGSFDHVGGYELTFLNMTKLVLTLIPTAVVIWYVLVDFAGSALRIWKSRNE
jgi:hypothetical protein